VEREGGEREKKGRKKVWYVLRKKLKKEGWDFDRQKRAGEEETPWEPKPNGSGVSHLFLTGSVGRTGATTTQDSQKG